MSRVRTQLEFSHIDDLRSCVTYLRTLPLEKVIENTYENGNELTVWYNTTEDDVCHIVDAHAHGFHAAAELFRQRRLKAYIPIGQVLDLPESAR